MKLIRRYESWIILILALIVGATIGVIWTLSRPSEAAPTEPDHFEIMLVADGEEMWRAVYDRTLDARTGWDDGDRQAYRCAYMFLIHRGQVAGRVTFTRVQAAGSYALVNDKFMDEGQRYFDGTVDLTPSQHDDCPAPDQDYEPYTGPDQRPVITYENLRGVLETRDYTEIAGGPGVIFRLVENTPQRVTVVAYKNSLPVIVVYYDSMSSRVTMHSDLG